MKCRDERDEDCQSGIATEILNYTFGKRYKKASLISRETKDSFLGDGEGWGGREIKEREHAESIAELRPHYDCEIC